MKFAQPQPEAAINLIHKQPVRWTKTRIVSCDGGGGPLGHPKIFINVDKPQICWCTYCGLPFVRTPRAIRYGCPPFQILIVNGRHMSIIGSFSRAYHLLRIHLSLWDMQQRCRSRKGSVMSLLASGSIIHVQTYITHYMSELQDCVPFSFAPQPALVSSV